MTPPQKPLGRKAYGSIPHLPGSKFGNRDDRGVNPGEAALYLDRANPGDRITVTEKLDGSCCAVLKAGGYIIPLIRAGYSATDSPWQVHRLFAQWVKEREDQFSALLNHGDRCVGEWLAKAHGIRYDLRDRSPFAIFDIFQLDRRLPTHLVESRVSRHGFAFVPVLYSGGDALPLQDALARLGEYGHYGAIDPAEGVVYRRETAGGIFLAKYVRPDAEPGRYLTGNDDPDATIWNMAPDDLQG